MVHNLADKFTTSVIGRANLALAFGLLAALAASGPARAEFATPEESLHPRRLSSLRR